MLTVSPIAPVVTRVKDIAPILDFYANKLGFEEMLRLDRDGRLWLVDLRITDTQYLEVFPEGEGQRAPGAASIGCNHMCLQVSDIEQSVRERDTMGVERIRPTVQGADGNWQTWIQDPEGHGIELMQISPNGLQARAIAKRSAVQ